MEKSVPISTFKGAYMTLIGQFLEYTLFTSR